MTKNRVKVFLSVLIPVILFVAAIVLFFLLLKTDIYESKYRLEKCDVLLNEYNNENNEVHFDNRHELGNVCVYFDSQSFNGEAVDNIIDSLRLFDDLFRKKQLSGFPDYIYVSKSLIFNEWKSDNNFICFSVANDVPEEIFAWLLYYANNSSGEKSKSTNAPFGLYAGIASCWLQMSEYANFAVASIEESDYLTEFQFPLYETNNLSDKERKYVWSFSTYIVKSMLSSGKTETEILSLDRNALDKYLTENFNIALPDYSFEPYSTQYEYKVEQAFFTYYINKEFNDLILPKSYFSTSYDKLSDWLKDNAMTTAESNKVFDILDMYRIDVFLDDGIKSKNITGYAYDDYIKIYSVGSFSHEYIHHVLFYLRERNGNASEVIPEMHANTSKYSRGMWYYLLTGQAEKFPYDKEVDEKSLYLKAFELYKKYSAKTPNAENFNFWLFADCFSAVHTNKGTPFVARLQPDSLAYYIARVYGKEYVWQINSDTHITIDGKPYLDIVDEWYLYIKSLNK